MKSIRVFAAMLTAALCAPAAPALAQDDADRATSELLPVFDAPEDAFGSATVDVDDEQRALRIDVENLPPGFYDLRVDGQYRGTFSVSGTTSKGDGDIAFFEPVTETGQRRLSFDTAGALVEVFPSIEDQSLIMMFDNGADSPVLSGIIAPGVAPEPGDDPIDGFRRQRAQTILASPGPGTITGRRAIVTLNATPQRATIGFKITNIPQGAYTLTANGLTVAEFEQPRTNGGARIILSTRPMNGQQRLSFDPTETFYEVRRLDGPDGDLETPEVVLSGMLPGARIEGGLSRVGVAGMTLDPRDPDLEPDGLAIISLVVTSGEFLLDVELQDVDPGTWTIRADGDIAARFDVVQLDPDLADDPDMMADDDPFSSMTLGVIRLATNPLPDEQAISFNPLGSDLEIVDPTGRTTFQTRLPGSMTMDPPQQP